MLRSLLVTILLAAPLPHAHADLVPLPEQPTDVPWPTTEWPVGSLPADMDSAAFSAAITDAFDKRAAGLGETREVVIIRGGRLIYERAATGYSTNMRLVSWSMAKSITQALVGVAVAQGKIDIDRPMGSPHWSSDDRRAQIP